LAGEGEEEDRFDAMGNKIEGGKRKAKLTSSELRKKKKVCFVLALDLEYSSYILT